MATRKLSVASALALIDGLPSDYDTSTEEELSDGDAEYVREPSDSSSDQESRSTDGSESENKDSDNEQDCVTIERTSKFMGKVEYIERFVDKNGHELTQNQLKDLLVKLQNVGDKKDGKITIARLKSLFDVARRNWKDNAMVQPCMDFTKHVGPVMDHFSNDETAGSIFFKFIDSDVFENNKYLTNLYITQKNKRVQPLTTKELYAFLGIDIVSAYHQLPSIRDNWRNDADLSLPYVASIMTRSRFQQILSHLHVNDNTKIPENCTAKFFKLKPLINALNANYVKLYDVNQFLSIDESIIKFKGRHSIKHYNPNETNEKRV